MKKIFLNIFIPLFISGIVSAQGIKFSTGTFQALKDQAKREKKMVFVDCFTDWCGPCKWMTANTFKEEKAGKLFNEHFVNAAIDMEKGEGKSIAEKYGINSYPTYLFLSPDGKLLHRAVGSMELATFLEVGLNAINPEKQLATLQAKYEDGVSDTAFLRTYANALAGAGLPSGEVAEAYLSNVEEKQLLTKSGWLFLANHISDIASPWVAFVDKHSKEYMSVAGTVQLDQWMNYVVGNSQRAYYQEHGLEGVENWKELLRKYVPSRAQKLEIAADYVFRTGLPVEESHPFAKAWFDQQCESFQDLNSAAWNYFENVEDQSMLQDALWWAQRSVEMYEGGFNTDTEANLLAKLGRWKEAEKMAVHSIEVGKKNEEATEDTEKLLKQIQTHL